MSHDGSPGRSDRLPLTYDECRARFRRACHTAGAPLVSYPIDAPGPEGQQLSIDVATIGVPRPDRALVVMSGVHGVEGFIGSALQCELLGRLGSDSPATNRGVLLVHAVNPWGMAWWRRQNESNVDLNRNWDRDNVTPPHNEGYAELHALLVPDTPTLPSPESFLEPAAALVADRGLPWLRDAIAVGQYSHPDGLHFGGDRTEQSTSILASIAGKHLRDASLSLCVDLHTGHGPSGTYTILSDATIGTEPDRWLREHFDPARIEATVDNPDATTGRAVGQLGHGITGLFPDRQHRSMTLEFGTVSDVEMIVAERAENWLYRHGDRDAPYAMDIITEHRRCFTPDDPTWAHSALTQGRTVLDSALRAISA